MRRFTSTLQLRLLLGLFFLALALPSAILVRQAYTQLERETFYQYRSLAEELSARIDSRFRQLISAEESRSFADYSFLVVSGTREANYLQPSPLARFPVESAVPGLIGYFQLDARGRFSTPLLPQPASQAAAYGIPAAQLVQREQLQRRVQRILSDNRLVQPRPAEDREIAGRAGYTPNPPADRDTPDSVGYTSLPGSRGLSSVAPARRSAETSEEEYWYAQEEAERKDRSGKVYKKRGVEPDETVTGAAGDAFDDAASLAVEDPEETVSQQDSTASFARLKDDRYRGEQRQRLDELSDFGRVEDLNLASKGDGQQAQATGLSAESAPRAVRKEKSALPIVQNTPAPPAAGPETPGAAGAGPAQVVITMFESEIDPFDFAMMDSGHFVIYRNVWRKGERTIQGAIIEQQAFLQGIIEPLFRETGLSQLSDLAVAYQGSVFAAFGGVSGRDYLARADAEGRADRSVGETLFQSRLPAPFGDLELYFSIDQLPAGRGATVIGWAALVMGSVLLGGLLLMHHLGLRQIALARQQQDFVSSVSHELKTPLTSIRMYSEMLREGWLDPEKRKSYYDFIFDESERLSRLIANVLQLARMNRNDIRLDIKPVAVQSLFDAIRSKLSTQIESAGFSMTLDIDEQVRDTPVAVDRDCLTQVLINLVDNAIKFSSKAGARAVDISARPSGADGVAISVRDYGPGVPSSQMKKIFRLFYRSETELTRETVGTGIGLALVHQQIQAMGGKVDVVNRQPGAEFTVTLMRA